MNKLYAEPSMEMPPLAKQLDKQLNDALRPIFRKYLALGVNPREIAHFMGHVVVDLECIAAYSPDNL